MRMSSKKTILAASALAALCVGVRAEGPNVSGFVDVGYNYNLNGQQTNNFRSFDDNSNTFTLQNAKLGVDGKLANGVGYKVDIMYGHDAAIVNDTEDFSPTQHTGAKVDELQFNLQQAYLTFSCPLTGAGVTIGKFVTPFGVEVVEAKDNYNISRGLLFGYTVPFSHTGLKADKGFMDGKFTTTLGLVNGWDNMKDNNTSKTGIAQLGTTVVPRTSIMLGGTYGAEQATPTPGARSTQGDHRMLVDAIVKVTPFSKLTLIGNYDVGEEKFNTGGVGSHKTMTSSYQGMGFHANFQFTDILSLAYRFEYLDDDGGKTATDQVLQSRTLTFQAKNDGVIYRLEYRNDYSTVEGQFVDSKGNLDDQQFTLGAQVIVTF